MPVFGPLEAACWAGLWLCWARLPAVAVPCMTRFLSRSFENNWNIYKLLAHQKISKEKVERAAEPMPGCACGPPPASYPQLRLRE